jgi:hypothetical protein
MVSTREKTTLTHNINQIENDNVQSESDPFSMYGSGINLSNLNQDMLIRRWRAFSVHPEASRALDEILNEAVNFGDDDDFMKLDLSKVDEEYETNSARPLVDEIRDTFEKFKMLTDFDENVDNLFLQFLIDGQINYEAIYPIDEAEQKEKGIIDVQLLSPIGLRKIKIKNPIVRDEESFLENNKEYLTATDAANVYDSIEKHPGGYDPNREYTFYYYDKSAITEQQEYNYSNAYRDEEATVMFDDEQMITANSGKWDSTTKMYQSPINKAVRSLNHIMLIEDSILIFCITKSNQKRMFKVNTAGMNRKSADQYVNALKDKYSQKKFYNTSTGEISDRKVTQTINEDFWVAVRSDGTASLEVTNVEGVANASFAVMDELNYFRRKVFESFNIPSTRMNAETNTAYLGFDASAATINRDEQKFTKTTSKFRNRFMEIFFEFAKRDLIVRKVFGADDWYFIKKMIRLRYTNENEFATVKKFQLLTAQLDILDRIEPWRKEGYYSKKYIEREVLNRTDEEITKMQEEIEEELIAGDVRIETQEQMLDGGMGGGGMSGGGYSGGFTPLPSSAGEMGSDVFPEGFGEEVPENAPEEAPSPEEAPAPEELNQSVKRNTRKDKLILETLEKYKTRVPEGGFITVAGKRFRRQSGIFLPE